MLTWRDDETFEIGGIEYACCPTGRRFKSEPGRFCLLKARNEVEHYERLLAGLAPKRIIEIGTYDGASAALFAEIARPEKLVTIDRRAAPSEALTHFIAARGFTDTVSMWCGTDQGDTTRLQRAVCDAMATGGIDLVVDDASHLVELTRRTFNCVFPHLRPGGMYVIEDWSWAHTAHCGFWHTTDETPLTALIFEMIIACAAAPRVVANVDVFTHMTLITRGDAEIDPETFDISSYFDPRGEALISNMGSRNPSPRVHAPSAAGGSAGPWSLARSMAAPARRPPGPRHDLSTSA